MFATLAHATRDEPDRPEKDQERGPDASDYLVFQRHDAHAPVGVRLRVLLGEVSGDRRHLGLGLL
jgi:hypothetical protein